MVLKYRHELKFIVSDVYLREMEYAIKNIMSSDIHTNENGVYCIRSVYFDDMYKTNYYENENGVDPRSKYRIRIYNSSRERISLERKSKIKGMTGKESVVIGYNDCMRLINGQQLQKESLKNSLLTNFALSQKTKLLRPVMLSEYVRTPYVYKYGNVRVTFDRNIMASANVGGLFDYNIRRIALLPTGYHILEVKYDDYLPDLIAEIINNGHLQQTTFSKFFLGCKVLGGRI